MLSTNEIERMTDPTDPDYPVRCYTTTQVAFALGISRSTLRRLTVDHDFTTGGHWRYTGADVAAIVLEHCIRIRAIHIHRTELTRWCTVFDGKAIITVI